MLAASWYETAKILDGFVACLAAKEDAAIIQASVKLGVLKLVELGLSNQKRNGAARPPSRHWV